MNELSKLACDKLNNILNDIIAGKITADSLKDYKESLQTSGQAELDALANTILTLAEKVIESNNFLTLLSQGNLEVDPPPRNSLISPFKSLHASLRHLTWQTQRIAEGDYNHKVSFMGDFSVAFNSMVDALKEKRKYELALQESENKLRALIKYNHDFIWAIDKNYNLLIANERFLDYFKAQFGYEIKIGDSLIEIFEKEEFKDFKLAIENCFKGEKSIIQHEEDVGGKHIYLERYLHPIYTENDEIIGVSIFTKDITQRKLDEKIILDREQKLKELNAAKDKFFSIVAHDLKNFFNTLLGFSNLLVQAVYDEDKESFKEFAEILHQSSKNGYRFLENLLEWSRIQSGRTSWNPKKINLKNIIEENIELINNGAKAKGITLKNLVEDKIYAFADYFMIDTVVRNLLSNALKFTNSGGIITANAFINESGLVEVTVSDTGVGISKENLQKLFKIDSAFTTYGTAQEKGTGLGLILCMEFIEKNKGKIWVESEKGVGTTFHFTLNPFCE